MYYLKKNPHGGNNMARLDFSASVNPLGTPEAVKAAAKKAVDKAAVYPDPCCRELTEAIAEYEGVPESYILCGAGAAELIYACIRALRLKTALEAAPTFSEYSEALALIGGRMERYFLSREKNFTPDRGFLDRLKSDTPEAVFICNPNNPTGLLWDNGLLTEIFYFCKEKGVRLFIDECFLELAGGQSLKGLLPEYGGLVILKAFTKTWGMAGLRLGYCLSSDERLLSETSRLCPPWSVSLPAQAAGVAALGETEFLKKARALIEKERPTLTAALEDAGLFVCPSDANFLLFKAPDYLGERLLKKGVAIRDCRNFPGLGPGWYRVGIKSAGENGELTACIREAL